MLAVADPIKESRTSFVLQIVELQARLLKIYSGERTNPFSYAAQKNYTDRIKKSLRGEFSSRTYLLITDRLFGNI